ncbi:MAG: chemotaxis response regulator protein-glutamate methylesterase [Phycisphaerae bacterium]
MIRVGIVNDMRLAIEALRRSVGAMPDASVAWIAENGQQAVECCARDAPDVVLMDMIMPVMDGVEATRRIMARSPCPILVVTATVEGNASRVYEALGAGALDAVATPVLGPDGAALNAEPLIRKIRSIALLAGPAVPVAPTGPVALPAPAPPHRPAMVAIGSSTGGPAALCLVLKAFPVPAPWPIVIVQHVDADFAPGLASWLATETGHRMEVIAPGHCPRPGAVQLAATGDHLLLDRAGRFVYSRDPVDLPFRPSVNVFFDSLVDSAYGGVAIVLTGMGRDGATGMQSLRRAGWHTIAQDRATSVVWGMPGACVDLNAAVEVLPVDQIGHAAVARMRADLPGPVHPPR